MAFAHLCQFVFVPFGGLKEYLESDCTNLLSFVERMRERYWPDWEEMCKSLDLNTHLPKKVEEVVEEKKEEKEEKKDEEKKDEKEEKKEEEVKVVEEEKKAEEKPEEEKKE